MPLPHVKVPPRKWHWSKAEFTSDPAVKPNKITAECGRKVARVTVVGVIFGSRPHQYRCKRWQALYVPWMTGSLPANVNVNGP